MAVPLPVGWVRMQHPSLTTDATCTQEAFDQVYAPLGWEISETNPPTAPGPATRHALTADNLAGLPPASSVPAGVTALVGVGGNVQVYESDGASWDALSFTATVPDLPFELVRWDSVTNTWDPITQPDKLHIMNSTDDQFATAPNDVALNDGDWWVGHRLSEL